MSIELITLIMFGGLIVTLILGLPLAWGMLGISVIITWLTLGPGSLYLTVASVFGIMWNIIFIAIPLFIFQAIVLENSGIADALFDMMYRWSGPVRGGLAMGTVVICAIFGAMSGITAAATVTMGLIAIPAMLKRGYDKSLALGCVAAGGTLPILIPPSVSMVLLSTIGRISVGKLFMAGLMPGLLLAFLYIAYIAVRSLLQPELCPAHGERFTLRERIVSIRAVLLPSLIIVSILGTIFFGIATPTEAAAVGAVALLIALAIQRKFTWQIVRDSTFSTFRMTGMIIWICFAAVTFTTIYTALGGMKFITELIMGLQVGPTLILLAIMFVLFILGMFLDVTGLIFLVGPIGYPIAQALGFDPFWFTILFVINLQMGYITPPVGYNLFYLKATAPPGVSLADIYRSIWPYLGIMAVGMALVWIFPEIALWFPNIMAK